MGRAATEHRPSISGAIIFYGTAKSVRRKRRKGNNPDLNNNLASTTGTRASVRLQSSSAIGQNRDSLGTSASCSTSRNDKSDPRHLAGSLPSGEISSLASSEFSSILALTKDVALLFANVPYIQAVTTVIQQIIQVANDVQANKDRAQELIDKIMIYAGVIFDSLNSSQLRSEKELSDLKADLSRIASALDSIYTMLQSLTYPSMSARIGRVVQRKAVLDRLQEQDRRLDTLITSFQLKSSIVVRAKSHDVPITNQQRRSPAPYIKLRRGPSVFFGRESEIEQIVSLIQENSTIPIAIMGAGGIGKTTLALSVLHDQRISARFQKNRFFVTCEAASSADHIIDDLVVALHITFNDYVGTPLDAILDCLGKAPHLVVLDNLETPWGVPTSRVAVENVLQELAGLDTVTLVVTIRGSQRPSGVQWSQFPPPLQPVGLDAAIEIFEAISHKADEFAVQLIKAVDCVPLAVSLLGNLAAVDGETTEALWRRWTDENIAMVENGDDRLSNLERSIEISLSSPRIERDLDAMKLLSLFSLLPDIISSEAVLAFENGIPDITYVRKALSTLIQNALVTKDASGCIRILSPIRLHMRARRPPSSDARRFLQDYFLDLVDGAVSRDDSVIQKRFRTEYGNIEAMLLDCLEMPLGRQLEDVVEAIISFCHHAYLIGASSTHAISLAADRLAFLTIFPPSSAGPVVESRKSVVRRIQFWKTVPKSMSIAPLDGQKSQIIDDVIKLRGDCLGCLGQFLCRQANFEEAEKKFNLSIKLHVQARDASGHAYDLHNLGYLKSRNLKTVEQAQATFEHALRLHEDLHDSIGAAYDLMGLGQLLLQASKPTEAKAMFFQALQLFTDNSDETGQSAALNNLGHTVLSCSHPSDAERYFLQAYELSTAKDDVAGRADSLAGLASTLLLRSQFLTAKEKIEAAISLRSPMEHPDYIHLLGRIEVALYDFEAASVSFLRSHALHLQMGDERGCAEDNNYLLQIDFFQGQILKDPDTLLDESASELDRCLRNYLDLLTDAGSVVGAIRLQTFDPYGGEELLRLSMTNTTEEDALKLGYCHHHIGCFYLRTRSFDLAESSFETSLAFHEESENVQGQADNHNKLSELALRRGFFQDSLTRIASQALRLHTQIGDIAGQGHDLYIQACVFLGQSRLEEAEETVRQALELHKRSKMVHGQGLDLAILSSILWQKYLASGRGRESMIPQAALHALENAAEIFARCVALMELSQCQSQYKTMSEFEPAIETTSRFLLTYVPYYD